MRGRAGGAAHAERTHATRPSLRAHSGFVLTLARYGARGVIDLPLLTVPMPDESQPSPEGRFLVYQTEDGKLKIDVRFEGESKY
jgi:hypothetical protein